MYNETIDKTMEADSAILMKLFNGLLNHAAFPASWKRAKWVPIPKPGRTDLSIPNNIELILLLLCISKTVTAQPDNPPGPASPLFNRRCLVGKEDRQCRSQGLGIKPSESHGWKRKISYCCRDCSLLSGYLFV